MLGKHKTRYAVNTEVIGLTVGLGGLAVGFASLIFLTVQVRLLRIQVRQAERVFMEEQGRTRRQASLEFMTATMERRRVAFDMVPSGSMPRKVTAFLRDLNSTGKGRRELGQYLSLYEMLAVGVNLEALDIDVVDRSWGSVIIRTWDAYEDYIQARRKSVNQPTLYSELELLVRKLRHRRVSV
jgi:hypothetical protein